MRFLGVIALFCCFFMAGKAKDIDLNANWRFSDKDDPGCSALDFDDSGWKKVKVPGYWKHCGFSNVRGIGWYRCRVILDSAARVPRQLVMEGVARCDETYFNGKLIGKTGDFSDDFSNQKYRMRIYEIPPELIRRENIIAVRVFPGRELAGGGLVRPVRIRELSEQDAFCVKNRIDEFYYAKGGSFAWQPEIFNRTTDARSAVLRTELRDFSGNLLMYKEWPLRLNGREKLHLECSAVLPETGIYTVRSSVLVNGEEKDSAVSKAAVLPTVKPAVLRDSRFGVASHLNWWDEKSVLRSLDLMNRIQLGSVRTGFIWREIEPVAGKPDFSRTDLIVREAAKRGLTVLPIISSVPSWAAAGKAHNKALPLVHPAEQRKYLSRLMKRYQETVKIWEFDNEPNLNKYLPQEYAQALRGALETAETLSPKPAVLVGGLSSVHIRRPGRIAAPRYLAALYEEVKGFSGVAFHPYIGWPKTNGRITESFLKSIDSVINVMKAHGKTPELYLTEYSTSIRPDEGRTEVDQARFLAVTTVSGLTRKEVRGFYWYNFRNKGVHPTDGEMNYGLLNMDFSPHTAFVAYAVLIDQLRFLNWSGMQNVAEGVTLHVFENASRKVLVGWTDSGTVSVRIPDVEQVVDLVGTPRENKGEVELSTLPVYITVKK